MERTSKITHFGTPPRHAYVSDLVRKFKSHAVYYWPCSKVSYENGQIASR